MPTQPFILRSRDWAPGARSLIGGKLASLGELIQAGARVPPWFAVTTFAYERALEHDGLLGTIRRAMAAVDVSDQTSLEAASLRARELIEGHSLPAELDEQLHEAYTALASEIHAADVAVAVRSSAMAEDADDASFAGQQETYLWVRGHRSVALHVLRCWSSLYTPQAISYRARLGLAPDAGSMSVGVQQMVDARVAGVMFTLNPSNGDLSKIGIEASWGLGVSVVGGEVTPDRYWVDKVTLDVLRREISPKTMEYRQAPDGGIVRVPVAEERQAVPCLSDEEVVELARQAKAIEAGYGSPRDIEWAIDARLAFPENVLLLQCRPETVWSNRAPTPLVAPKTDPLDYVTDRMLSGLRGMTRS